MNKSRKGVTPKLVVRLRMSSFRRCRDRTHRQYVGADGADRDIGGILSPMAFVGLLDGQ